MTKTKTIKTDQGVVEYALLGDGFPVLAIHGSPGGWDQVVCEFSFLIEHGFKLIVVSRPGYCKTPLSSGVTVQQQAELLANLMELLNIDRYAIVAWSGGGPAAIYLAASQPNKVSALYLQACVTKSNIYTEEDQKATEPFFKRTNAVIIKLITTFFPKSILIEMIRSAYPYSNDEIKSLAEQLLVDPSVISYVKSLVSSMIPPSKRVVGFRNDIKQFKNLNDLPLTRVQSPTLIIQGKIDTTPTPDNAEYAAGKIEKSVLMLFDDLPHIPRLSLQYLQIQDHIIEFLTQYTQ